MENKKVSEDIKVYTLEEVSEILNVTHRTMYEYLKNGKLKGFKLGNKWRISHTELKRFLDDLQK